MKLRPYLRSFVSSQVSIEEKNKSKPNPEHNNSIRRKKSADRRLGLKDIGSLQEGMEDRTEAPDKHSECQRNDNKMECVATPSGNIASGNSGQYQLVESQACSVIYTAPSIEDVKNFDEDLSNMETSTSPSRRRRFLSGNHLSPHTAESSHFLPHSADSGNGDYQLRRNSTMQTNIRHRSGSFNPTILTQHKMVLPSNAILWQDASEGKIPSNSLAILSRFGGNIYFCKATYQGNEVLGTLTTGQSACTFSTSKSETEALTSEDYQVFGVEATDGKREWVYANDGQIPKNAITCGPDCYLGQSIYGDGLCLESIGRISPEKKLIYMTSMNSDTKEKEIVHCSFYMFLTFKKQANKTK